MIYIQLIGALAFCILVLSFYRKTNTQILTYQITSNFAYAVHYFLLGGISGAISSVVGMFRNIVFINVKKHKKIASIIFVFIYLVIAFIFYDKFYSVFPICGNASYLFTILKGSKKSLLIGGILNSIFWLLYSIFVFSYVCIITESILIISNSIQLIRLRKSKVS